MWWKITDPSDDITATTPPRYTPVAISRRSTAGDRTMHHHVDVDRSVVDARRAGGWRRARRGGRRGGGHGHCGAGRRTGVCRRVRAPFPIIFAMSVTTSVSWSVGFDEAPPLFPYCRLQASTTLAAIQSTVASSAEASAHRGRRRRTFPGLRCVAQTGHRAFACALPAGPCPRRT